MLPWLAEHFNDASKLAAVVSGGGVNGPRRGRWANTAPGAATEPCGPDPGLANTPRFPLLAPWASQRCRPGGCCSRARYREADRLSAGKGLAKATCHRASIRRRASNSRRFHPQPTLDCLPSSTWSSSRQKGPREERGDEGRASPFSTREGALTGHHLRAGTGHTQ